MITTHHKTVEEFLALAQTSMEQHEAQNNLMLGMSRRIKNAPHLLKIAPYFATVTDRQHLILAAMITPPFKLLVYSAVDDYGDAVNLFAHDIYAVQTSIPGVQATPQLAKDFAEAWSQVAKVKCYEGVRQGLYELRKVIPPKWANGTMSAATKKDLDLLEHWAIAFNKEALGASLDDARALVERKIEANDLYIWVVDDKPVAMASIARPTRTGIAINFVYTPPELRGKGYASSVVAALSQRQLDSGFQFCMLFTDLSNPISNSIYQKIGYQPIGDATEYLFET